MQHLSQGVARSPSKIMARVSFPSVLAAPETFPAQLVPDEKLNVFVLRNFLITNPLAVS